MKPYLIILVVLFASCTLFNFGGDASVASFDTEATAYFYVSNVQSDTVIYLKSDTILYSELDTLLEQHAYSGRIADFELSNIKLVSSKKSLTKLSRLRLWLAEEKDSLLIEDQNTFTSSASYTLTYSVGLEPKGKASFVFGDSAVAVLYMQTVSDINVDTLALTLSVSLMSEKIN